MTSKRGFPPVPTAIAAILLVVVGLYVFSIMAEPSHATFKEYVTLADDGVPFERYCGYLVKVGRGEITFENEEPISIAYLFFRNGDGTPSITKVIYERPEVLGRIKPNQYYDIAARKYSEGFSFPRRLDIVGACPDK